MAQHWEYAQLIYLTTAAENHVSVHFTHQERWPDSDALWESLRRLGDEGWEMIGPPVPLPQVETEVTGYMLWFKRPTP